MTAPVHVIATDRPRYYPLVDALQERHGDRAAFHLIRDAGELTPERLNDIAPRYVFFPHWSSRIPAAIHQHHECVIFHMTDVPYGRGGSPLQNLIVRGHTETRLSALRCDEELDAGPVYLKRSLSLAGSAEQILQRAGELMVDMIEWIVAQEPQPEEQRGEPVIFQRRTPAQSTLANAQSLADWFDHIRMLDAEGYPPAFLDAGDLRLEFSDAEWHGTELQARVRIRPRDEDEQ